MKSMTDLLTSVSAVFTDTTGTGLDVLSPAPKPAAVAEFLVASDRIPATYVEVRAAHRDLYQKEMTSTESAEVELFLIEFGWLA